MEYKPPSEESFEKNINVSAIHPLREFFQLIGILAGILIVIYFILGFTAEYLITKISPETEVKIFQKSFLSSNESTKNAKSEYIEKLLKKIQASNKSINIPLNTEILEMATPNAFMGIGGNISVTSGLLTSVKSENELMMVLCHEIGHFVHRDPIRSLGRGLIFFLVLSMTGIGSEKLGSTALNFGEKAHSRSQEQAADYFAVDCLYKVYGHTEKSTQFFESMAKLESSIPYSDSLKKVFKYSQTHPLSEDRVQNIRNYIRLKSYPETGKIFELKKNF